MAPGEEVVPRSGEVVVAPLATTTFTLTCDGQEGPAVADVTVQVMEGPRGDGGAPDAGEGDAGIADAGDDDGSGGDAGDGIRDGGSDVDAGSDVDVAPAESRGPLHRYPFDDNSDPLVALDVVGGAHGAVRGNAEYNNSGGLQVELDGYVDLPNGMISALNAVTFEAWVIWDGDNAGDWQRIFDFGSTSVGEVTELGGVYTATNSHFLQLSPQSSEGSLRLTLQGDDGNLALRDDGPLPADTVAHVAVTYDVAAAVASLYVDGAAVGSAPWSNPLSDIDDVNCWLGRSNFSVDPGFDGVFLEVRLYGHALTSEEVEASFAAGPDLLWWDD